jgi:uncharacterized protein (DUF4415 family)
VVKLTDKQKRELEALRNMSDDEIDCSDIPPITDWSGFRMGLFYRPKWRDFSLKLDENITDWFEGGLVDGEQLGEAVNKALGSEMYRIRFPIRVQRVEELVQRIKESPEDVAEITDWEQDQVKVLYKRPIEEVAFPEVPLKPVSRSKTKMEPQAHPIRKKMTLKLDENCVDWFEYGLDEGQSLDEAINKALMDHITWLRTSQGMKGKEEVRQAKE